MNLKSLVIALSLLGASGTQAADRLLFRTTAELGKSSPTQERVWTAEFDAKALGPDTAEVLLPVPGHVPMRALRTGAQVHEKGFTWQGQAGGWPVTLTVLGGHVHGDFHIGLEHYTLSSQRGRTVLALASRFETAEDVETLAPAVDAKRSTPDQGRRVPGPVTVRVLMAYTPAVDQAAGGAQAVASAAQFMIAQLNGMMTQSVASEIRFEMTAAQLVNYQDGITTDVALQYVSSDPLISYMRNETMADIVVLMVENTDFAGRAYMPNSISMDNAQSAFAVVARNYATNYYSFAHEVGHLFGLDHGGGGATQGAFPWGVGHVGYVDANQGYPEGFVTVMASIGTCGGSPPCHYVPYFANPEMIIAEPPVRGRTLGLADESDGARAMRDAALTVSMYRHTKEEAAAAGFGQGLY
jgi:hypothetical protein